MLDKLQLMVVDDEPDNLDLLYRTFRRDFQVFKATSAFEALEILDRVGEMAIIISDQRMPKMNGTEFLSRTVDRFPDTIRIVLTGYTDVEDLVEAINSGKVFKYITKPWNPENLKNVVLQAADTYRLVKQRTKTLTQALRRESLINEVMSAVRESLDYKSMLQTVVNTLARTFEADYALLRPWQAPNNGNEQPQLFTAQINQQNSEPLSDDWIAALQEHHYKRGEDNCGQETCLDGNTTAELETLDALSPPVMALTVPLVYQRRCLAMTTLYQVQHPTWTDDSLNLMHSISDQVALAINQSRLYQQVQDQSRQMRAELEVARQIQMNLLRQSWPEIEGLRIQARCLPAREVGGDFFEIFAHPSGDIWFAVGDVSGKGVPAALFMASAISVLRRELSAESPPPPNEVMRALNAGLMDDLVSNNCFITMVLVRYSPTTGQLAYANAGHIYPMVWPVMSPPEQPQYLEVRGVPLGILPVWKAEMGSIQMAPGDSLLLSSDGLTEATLAQPQGTGSTAMLQQEGLWRILQQQPPPLELDQLLETLRALSHEQEDDQTVLLLEVQP